jgi:hypothetical protein
MQNSLERIFEGTAASLREHVLPLLDDPYARAQVAAATELLGNLATRVEWRADQLAEEVSRIREVLAAAPTPAAVLDEEVPVTSGELLGSRARHLDALVALQGGPEAAAVDGELRAFSAWQLDRELALLRTGMYK